MKDFQLDIFGNLKPVELIKKEKKYDKQYKVKYYNWLKKGVKKNAS